MVYYNIWRCHQDLLFSNIDNSKQMNTIRCIIVDDEPFALKVGVVGSLGCACREILDEIGREHGLEFVKFLKSPIDELVKYHGI